MKFIRLYDRVEIESRLRKNTSLHLYELGDLDDFFWPYTSWYSLKDNPEAPVILYYTGTDLPVLMALEQEPTVTMRLLISELIHQLPHRFYSHLTAGIREFFRDQYRLTDHGQHSRMSLANASLMKSVSTSEVIQLTKRDLPDLLDLYHRGSESNWFDPRMIETNCFFGIRKESRLISVAGIHSYSKQYRVAALGNVFTDPQFRGRGLATQTCAKLCQYLLTHIDNLGLNVASSNTPAVALYKKLGFAEQHVYYETMHESD